MNYNNILFIYSYIFLLKRFSIYYRNLNHIISNLNQFLTIYQQSHSLYHFHYTSLPFILFSEIDWDKLLSLFFIVCLALVSILLVVLVDSYLMLFLAVWDFVIVWCALFGFACFSDHELIMPPFKYLLLLV